MSVMVVPISPPVSSVTWRKFCVYPSQEEPLNSKTMRPRAASTPLEPLVSARVSSYVARWEAISTGWPAHDGAAARLRASVLRA